MRIMNFYDDVDSVATPHNYEVGGVNTRFNTILSYWCFVILCTMFYNLFVV